ncbi:hypothetical protein [Methylibium petroleiphilum]|uniref:hypothetical protein n=1 Tax=Methylibium petroleiphilum TaxID=105560 RepID=UPI001ACA692E|nr:hypothetical protein [Methylibium petroleiphilum]MBN9206122.1 hypothetical protein [Methylibium petroleiphilum]
MDRDTVKAALIAVLKEVQALSGEACPPIGDTTKPIDDLPKFDSKVWPVAIGLVGIKLGAEVPVDVNVFRQEHTKIPNTIEQTVTAILKAIQTMAAAAPSVPAKAAEEVV